MYLDVAYCYRPSSMVCLSVCHTSQHCKNGWTDRDPVWVVGLDGPKGSCVRWESRDAETLPWDAICLLLAFWLSMGYNFGCMIAINTLFDSRGGFSGQAIRWRQSRFRGSKGRCHNNHFWLSAYRVDIGTTWRIRLNHPLCGDDTALCQITLTACLYCWTCANRFIDFNVVQDLQQLIFTEYLSSWNTFF